MEKIICMDLGKKKSYIDVMEGEQQTVMGKRQCM